jgi:hypothetical protein
MSYNQPKRFEKLDLIIDGEIKTNNVVISETNNLVNLFEEVGTIKSTISDLQTSLDEEVSDRKEQDDNFVETIEYVTGVEFKKPEDATQITSYGWAEEGKDQDTSAKGFDTVVEYSGYLSTLTIGCRYGSGSTGTGGDIWVNVWKNENGSYKYLGTSFNSQVHTVGETLTYQFTHGDIEVNAGDKLRITYHSTAQITAMKDNNNYTYNLANASTGCLRVNRNRPNENFIYITSANGASNFVAAHTMVIIKPASSLHKMITDLMNEVVTLKAKVAALESAT